VYHQCSLNRQDLIETVRDPGIELVKKKNRPRKDHQAVQFDAVTRQADFPGPETGQILSKGRQAKKQADKYDDPSFQRAGING
jgi:hypothetical protein